MLGHLIRKEILDQLLSLRFIILSAIAALTIWLSLYQGYSYYRARVKDYHMAQAMTEEWYRQLGDSKSFGELRRLGFKEHKPPTPMSIFIRGLEPTLGRSISNSSSFNQLKGSPVEAEPIMGIFPQLDLGLVVQVVLGLFALLLTYDAVCGEKERGTLRLAASFPAPRNQILLGKFIGVSVSVLAAFCIPLLMGIAVLVAMPDVAISLPEWVRLIFILGMVGLYLSTLMCAGLFASCLSNRSAISFVILLIFWVATVVIIPRVSLVVAEIIHPMPTFRERQEEGRKVSASIEVDVVPLGQWEEQNPDWRETPEGREARQIHYWKLRNAWRARGDFFRDHFEEWFGVRDKARLELALALARLSPAFAFHNGTVRLAGTGIDRHQRFENTFKKDYLRVYRDWYNTSVHLDLFRENWPEKYGQPIRDFSEMPRLDYRERWPQGELESALTDFGLLGVWGLVFFAGAYVTMLRYDPR